MLVLGDIGRIINHSKREQFVTRRHYMQDNMAPEYLVLQIMPKNPV